MVLSKNISIIYNIMSFEIITKLLLTLCFGIILISSSFIFYLPKSNYKTITAQIEKAECEFIPKKRIYVCNLNINYAIDDILIRNEILIKSDVIYKDNDLIEIEYDQNNYLNISQKTNYKIISLLSSISGLILLLMFLFFYDEIKNNIFDEINKISRFIPTFKF